jgi:hypothetical protein
MKEYREKNKEYFQEYKKEYNEKNKEQIREYREQHKEKTNDYNKDYYEKNKDKLLQKHKEIYKIKIECDICKSIVRKDFLKKHQKTKKCMNFSAS